VRKRVSAPVPAHGLKKSSAVRLQNRSVLRGEHVVDSGEVENLQEERKFGGSQVIDKSRRVHIWRMREKIDSSKD
jgi:hypothetical protein